MAIEWITSRAGADSDSVLLKKIGRQAANDPLCRIIVLVPPQATMMTENHIMRALGLPGLMGVQVMGPEKLAQRILDSVFGRAKPVVDLPAKSMVAAWLLETYSEQMTALSACARAQNISADIAKIISEFKAMDIEPGQIKNLQSGSTVTDQKLADLAFLYEKFNEYMQSRALTLEDRMNIAISHVQECRFIAESDVFVLHFDLLTSQLERLIAEIAKTAKNTCMSFLDTNQGDPDADLFEATRRQRLSVARRLGIAANNTILPNKERRDAIGHIEKNLYAYPYAAYKEANNSVQIICAQNPQQEVAAAAEMIARLVSKDGYAMWDIAVVCGKTQDYANAIEQLFTRASIPFFLDDKRNACKNFAAGAILSALEMASGRLSKEKLLAHIEFVWGMDNPGVSVLKNYAFQKISNAYQFEKPFDDSAAEEARLRCVLPALAYRKKAMEAKTAAEKIILVQEYVAEIKLEDRVTACMRNFEKNGIPASIDYFEQSYKAICDILAQAKELLGALTLNGYNLAALLRSGFESAVISLIPQGADEVLVGDIGISRLQDIRTLIVLGVNEGKIPNYEEESGILAQQEKDLIYAKLLQLGNTSQITKQKLAIYRSFSLPSERLVLLYSQTGKEPMQPSSLIARMHELFSIQETDASKMIGGLRENAMLLAQAELRNLANGYHSDKEYLACLLAREDTRDLIVDMGRFAARTNVAKSLLRPVAAELYPKGTASASRYEAYYSCPFRHYVLYGLHAEVPRECTLAGVDVGNFVHGVLDSVSREIKNTGRTWKAVSQGELVELLRQSSQEVRERDFKYTVSPRNMNVLRTVERELYWALSAIRQHFETSCLEMEETEHAFELDVGGIRIRGTIDRLDMARAGDTTWFKVVDYKTGQKEWFLQDFVEGLSLQLVIYMLAGMEYLRHLDGNVRPAGADYFTVKLPLLEEYEPEKILSEFKMQGLQGVGPKDAKQVYGFDGNGIVSVSLRLKKDGTYYAADSRNVYTQEELSQLMEYAKKLITGAAAEIEAGNVKIAPVPNQQNVPPCTYCDFRSVCMLDDAQVPQKKERQPKDLLLQSVCKKD